MTAEGPGQDDGTTPEVLAHALAAWSAAPSPASYADVVVALLGSRVFAAVTAAATGEEVASRTGLRAESGAEMALLTLERAADGGVERALPVFTSVDALVRWRPDARPVTVPGELLAAAAREQGAQALLVDLVLAVEGPALTELAAGWTPVRGADLAARSGPVHLRPVAVLPAGLLDALSAALATETGVLAAAVYAGPDGPVLAVHPRAPLTATDQAALAQRLLGRARPALPAAGLDLVVLPQLPPGGTPVPAARPARRFGIWAPRRRLRGRFRPG